MKIIYRIILVNLILFSLFNCKSNENDTKNHEHLPENTVEEEHEESSESKVQITQQQMKEVGMKLGKVEQKQLTSTINAYGTLRVPNTNKATVAALFGGIIKTLNIQEGSYVKKGQTIATVSNPDYILIQEQYLTVLSQITLAEQEFSRQKELFDNDAGAKKNLQNSSASLKMFRTQKASLVRQLQMMGINPAKISNASLKNGIAIIAPISGTVSSISAEIGSYVDIASPVAQIIDNGSLHLDLQVFEKDLSQIKVGQIVNFTLTNNPTIYYEAKVFSIGSSFIDQSKTIAVHCNVIGNKSGLIDGMNISGNLNLADVFTPAVPNEAIVEADSKFYIFIKTEKNDKGYEFEKIEIVKGTSNMGYTAITPVKAINNDTEILVKGAFFAQAKLANIGDHSH